MSCATVRFESIDDCLGPSQDRFFSHGVKRVVHQVGDIVVERDEVGRGVVRGHASLTYPSDWSRKSADTALRPHLSSVDGLLLGVQLVELFLTHVGRLGPAGRRRAWLRGFTMRAGATPTEDLCSFQIEAVRLETSAAPFSLCGQVSTFQCVIGGIKLHCTVEHEPLPEHWVAGDYRWAEDLLGDPECRYFGTGHKKRGQRVRAVEYDPGRQQVEALVQVTDPVWCEASDPGFAGEYQPSVSPLESLTVLAQLSQVLLYETDRLERRQTNTLWMRAITMDSLTPYHPVQRAAVAAVAATRVKTLEHGGQLWRMFDVAADFQGFRFTSSLAHALPVGMARARQHSCGVS